VTALGADGTVLVDTLMRIVPPRSRGIPDGAADPDQAAEAIRTALAETTVLVWANDALTDLIRGLAALGIAWPLPSGYDRRHELRRPVNPRFADVPLNHGWPLCAGVVGRSGACGGSSSPGVRDVRCLGIWNGSLAPVRCRLT
jgi:hypothetical protein